MKVLNRIVYIAFLSIAISGFSQTKVSKMLSEIATAPKANNIKKDITTLVNFGTRHTLSDTISKTRGIGAARR